VSSVEVNGTRIYYEKRAAGPLCCSSPGPAAMGGTGQRSLTSSRTPTRSSRTIAGATPAACACRKPMPPG